jgi:hypothetical protein
MIWLLLFGSFPAWSSRTIEAVGTGITRDSAVEDAKRTAVEQVVGVYLTSRSQVKNFVLQDDTITSETAGFIRSYQVISCNVSKGLYNCRLAAEIEGDENKIATLLRRSAIERSVFVPKLGNQVDRAGVLHSEKLL